MSYLALAEMNVADKMWRQGKELKHILRKLAANRAKERHPKAEFFRCLQVRAGLHL